MKLTLQLEELAQFLLSLWIYHLTGQSWILFAALFFLPDLGMLGYLKNAKIGAWTYNILHHKGLAILLYALGYFMSETYFMLAGIILFSHASFDRILGYGLKYEEGFKFTHLGKISKD